jgi:hypothetical protein
MAAKQPPPPDRYAEAIAWFRNRVPMTDEEFAALDVAERQKAFTVAGVTQARPIQEIFNAIDRAIADGTTLDDFKDEVGAQLEDAWGGESPFRVETVFRTNIMCVLPGQFIQGRVVAASKAWYSGQVLQLRTKAGGCLAVTPNHPILTPRGFVPAQALRNGDDVLRCVRNVEGGAGANRIEEGVENGPALIEEVFRSLGRDQRGPVRRRLGPLDLHGDASGTNGYVDIVRANGNHLLEHAHQMMRTEHTVIVDADHAPALIDQPAIANKVMAAASCRPVILAIDLDSDELGHEGDVDQEGSSRMLGNCPSSEESEEMLFGWGEYLAIARGPGQGGATTDLMAMDGVAQKHSVLMALDRARCGGAQPPCPVVLAASLGDDARIATHDLHLVALGAHGDRMLAAPHREGSVGEGKLSLKGAKATLSGPVLLENHGLEGALVSEVEWHATTIVSIVGEEYFGELCDLTVDEDQSYVAAGIVVHNLQIDPGPPLS